MSVDLTNRGGAASTRASCVTGRRTATGMTTSKAVTVGFHGYTAFQ